MRKIIVLFLIILVSGCSDKPNELTNGRVIAKEFDDPDNYTTTYCVVYGKYGCQAYGVNNHYDPAHWKLKIQGTDGKEDLIEWHEVGERTYEKYSIGNHWELNK